jgi:NADPH:quinone reductase-like Zn-dependent oxidoreductase
VHKPAAATFEQAAAVPLAALAALQGLRNVGQVRAGYDVLINDASSGIGTFAVQIAKSCGAAVTGICQGRHVPLVRSIGADDALDAGHAEFAPRGHHYDLVLDAGGDRPFEDFIDVLKPRGTYVMVGGSFARRCRLAAARPLRRLRGGRRVESLRVQHNRVDLLFLSHLMDSGAVTPVIDRRYRLSEVPEAFHYLAQGHAAGKVVIAIDRESRPSSHRPPAA